MSETNVSPIAREDLPAVGHFLNEQLNRRISPEQWVASVSHDWAEVRPNFGVKLTDGERLVGVFLAIYSDQSIRGRTERVCNPHTWCVLKEYRSKAVGLAAALVKQPGYHFSMLTPNPNVDAVFRFMKFRELDARLSIFPNVPSPSGARVVAGDDAIRATLRDETLRDYERHADIPWLRHAVLEAPNGGRCWIVHKPRIWKKLPCADLLHVSDPEMFRSCLPALRTYLLLRCRMVWTRVETRFIGEPPPWSITRTRTQPKLFLSKTLGDGDVRDIYSELVSLDL